jgi:hypothetical protein
MGDRVIPAFVAALSTLLAGIAAGDVAPAPAERVKPYPLDITKPIDDKYSVYQELQALDEFLRSATKHPDFLYLPIHVSISRSEEVSQTMEYSCRLDDGTGGCAPDFFTAQTLSKAYAENWLDSDAERALTNFIRRILSPADRNGVPLSKPLALYEPLDAGPQAGFYGSLRAKEADDERRAAWFNNPCNLVAESGRDDGWQVVNLPADDLLSVALQLRCELSDSVGAGLAKLTTAELQSFERWSAHKEVVFKNQPSPELQGKPVGYEGKDLAVAYYASQNAEHYIRYLGIKPPASLQTIPSLFTEGETPLSQQLSTLEKQILRRLMDEARLAVQKVDPDKATRFPRDIKLVFGPGTFVNIYVSRPKNNELHFPASALRASFLQCGAPISKVILLVETEEACRQMGGLVRESADLSWFTNRSANGLDLDLQKRKSRLDQAKERVRGFVCEAANRSLEPQRLVEEFNACVVDKLWFLLHHELAHLYLRPGSAATEQSEDRADCYGLRAAVASRPKSSLGIFESGVIDEIDSPSAMSPSLLPQQIAVVTARYNSLKRVLPLASRGELTSEYCDSYGSVPP